MPDTPTPGVNGQSLPSQGARSISSFDPAATTLGLLGSIATDGSFCLFCGKGDAGLPLVTSESALAIAGSESAATSAPSIAISNRFLIEDLLRRQSPLPCRGIPGLKTIQTGAAKSSPEPPGPLGGAGDDLLQALDHAAAHEHTPGDDRRVDHRGARGVHEP